MNVQAEIAAMEQRLANSGASVKSLCDEADVSQSTWTRWKSGGHAPNLSTWGRVQEAFARLTSTPAQPDAA